MYRDSVCRTAWWIEALVCVGSGKALVGMVGLTAKADSSKISRGVGKIEEKEPSGCGVGRRKAEFFFLNERLLA